MDALIGPNDADVEQLITERKAARGQKDFDRADEIRKQLEQNGVLLEDRPDGSTDWRRV
jgi:cysteinyl-tRNA synthetase